MIRIQDMNIFPDPFDLNYMFTTCNIIFFSSELKPLKISYSTKMKNTAGYCISTTPIQIVLSLALIYETTQYELVNTLVHEMCHALIFQRREFDGVKDGHGPLWYAQANRLNQCFGLKITRYHYPISQSQLENMNRESEKRRQGSFLGAGRKLERFIDVVDLTGDGVVDLTDGGKGQGKRVEFVDID